MRTKGVGVGSGGFSLVEAMVAVGIFSMIAVLGSRSLLNNNRSLIQIRYHKRASLLAELVFQQYAAYARQNFQALGYYDVVNQTPEAFFNTTKDLGYHGVLITTRSSYSDTRSTCSISTTLTWTNESQRSETFEKLYAQADQTATGAAVQIWVKQACSGGTSDAATIANCAGVPGMTVSAPSASGGTASGITDAAGQVLLRSVSIGGAVPVQISAPPLTDFNVSTATTPGFYALDASHNPVLTVSKTFSADPSKLNTLVDVDFQPLAQIRGSVTLQAPNPASFSLANLMVGWSGAAVRGGALSPCPRNGCQVATDANGNYLINNVLASTGTVTPVGRSGSAPLVKAGDPAFVQGFAGASAYPITTWGQSVSPFSFPLVTQNLAMVPAGGASVDFRIQIGLQLTSQPATFPIQIRLPRNSISNTGQNPLSVTPDAAGHVNLYNVIWTNSDQMSFQGGQGPQSGNHGFYVNFSWTCPGSCIGALSSLTVPVTPGFLVTGTFVDDNSISAAHGMTVIAQVPTGTVQSVTDTNGWMSLDGVALPASADVTQPVPLSLQLQNTARTLRVGVAGQTMDTVTGRPAAHATLYARTSTGGNGNPGGGNGRTTITSDVNGYFVFSATTPFTANANVVTVCNTTSFTCVICPGDGTPCPVIGAPIHINSGSSLVSLSGSSQGYQCPQQQWVVADGAQGSAGALSCPLVSVPVNGTVQNSALTSIGGLTVIDGQGNSIATSSSGQSSVGAYTGWASVSGRSPWNAGNFGVGLPPQTVGGIGYGSTSVGPVNLPWTVDITQSTTENLTAPATFSASTKGGV